MAISKETMSLGMSCEKEYGYSQAVKSDRDADNKSIIGVGSVGCR
jgi:hypothetical protein